MMTSSYSQTLIPFELPEGLHLDANNVARQGEMRLATTEDEQVAQHAAHMMDNQAYGILVRLARVITLTGRSRTESLSPDDLGKLFMPDLTYLIELYNDINPPEYGLSLVGEPRAIPWSD